MEIQKDISLKINEKFVGKTLKVIIDSIEGEYYVGRSYRDAPEVDGEILINKKNNKLKTGSFYDVEIVDFDEYDLFANVLKIERKSK
jgi:ribosomal protein S12 methylthiotransferase